MNLFIKMKSWIFFDIGYVINHSPWDYKWCLIGDWALVILTFQTRAENTQGLFKTYETICTNKIMIMLISILSKAFGQQNPSKHLLVGLKAGPHRMQAWHRTHAKSPKVWWQQMAIAGQGTHVNDIFTQCMGHNATNPVSHIQIITYLLILLKIALRSWDRLHFKMKFYTFRVIDYYVDVGIGNIWAHVTTYRIIPIIFQLCRSLLHMAKDLGCLRNLIR